MSKALNDFKRIRCTKCGFFVTLKRLEIWRYPLNRAGVCKTCGRIYIDGIRNPIIVNEIKRKIIEGKILGV